MDTSKALDILRAEHSLSSERLQIVEANFAMLLAIVADALPHTKPTLEGLSIMNKQALDRAYATAEKRIAK